MWVNEWMRASGCKMAEIWAKITKGTHKSRVRKRIAKHRNTSTAAATSYQWYGIRMEQVAKNDVNISWDEHKNPYPNADMQGTYNVTTMVACFIVCIFRCSTNRPALVLSFPWSCNNYTSISIDYFWVGLCVFFFLLRKKSVHFYCNLFLFGLFIFHPARLF